MTHYNATFATPPPPTSLDGQPLAHCRDAATEMPLDLEIEASVLSLFEDGGNDTAHTEPLRRLNDLIERIRELPRGDARVRAMNTFVRTLGQPAALATFLDLLSHAVGTGGSEERLTELSRQARKHSLYGWRSTLLAASRDEPTPGTVPPAKGVADFLEFSPAKWGLHLHVWQPNCTAAGFGSGKREEVGKVVEPPHSHPVDFVSMVVAGSVHQSTYVQADLPPSTVSDGGGRYDGVILEHVDGVWPPQRRLSRCGLTTQEDRVELVAGQSYFMPFDVIHDVEVDAEVAATQPAVTLFFATEAMVRPNVYMAPKMYEYHQAHPGLEQSGRPLTLEQWSKKLHSISGYLSGEQSGLELDPILGHDSDYAFFHI